MTAENDEKNSIRDRELGMDRAMPRRAFLNGAAMAIGAAAIPAGTVSETGRNSEPPNHSGYDPPSSTGLRGSHPGSFEIAHSLRDGTFWKTSGKPIDTGEVYDLIVVGGGI